MAKFKPLPPSGEQHEALNNPITPPRELVEQWIYEDGDEIRTSPRWYQLVCTKAARWGADQELDACCDWLLGETEQSCINELRAARRPKPKSLAEEALRSLDHLNEAAQSQMDTTEAVDTIRRALERLQEMEEKQ